MEAVTALDRGFHRVNLADCLKAGINVTKPYGQIYNLFNYQRHLISRKILKQFRHKAQAEWNIVIKAVVV